MTMNAEASQAAAHYISALQQEFAPVVVAEFRGQVIALADEDDDQSQAVLDLIENHDVSNEHRTLDAYTAEMGRQLRGDDAAGADGGDSPAEQDAEDEEAAAPRGKDKPAPKAAPKPEPKPKADAKPAADAPKAAPKAASAPKTEAAPAPDAKPAAGAAKPPGATQGPVTKLPPGAVPDAPPGQQVTLAHGDEVDFEHGDPKSGVSVRGSGTIVASGQDGATVRDAEGREHKVRHANLKAKGKAPAKGKEVAKGGPPLIVFGKSIVWSSDPLPMEGDFGKSLAMAAHPLLAFAPIASPAIEAPAAPAAAEPASDGQDGPVSDPRVSYVSRAFSALRNLTKS